MRTLRTLMISENVAVQNRLRVIEWAAGTPDDLAADRPQMHP